MPDFSQTLAALVEKATPGDDWMGDDEIALYAFLRNHAPAILDLVRAAKQLQKSAGWVPVDRCQTTLHVGDGNRLATALRALDEAE